MEERKRRKPAVEKNIEELTQEDYRVRITGVVVDRSLDNYSAIVDDGTGRVEILFSRKEDFEKAEEGKLVRVIGKVIKDENIWIDVEIIQDMSRLDPALFKQVRYVEEAVK